MGARDDLRDEGAITPRVAVAEGRREESGEKQSRRKNRLPLLGEDIHLHERVLQKLL